MQLGKLDGCQEYQGHGCKTTAIGLQLDQRVTAASQNARSIAVAKERAAARGPAFVLGYKRRVKNGVAHIGVQSKHADQKGWSDRMYETFGTTSQHFVTQQLCRVAEALQDKDGNLSETTMESVVAILDAAQPANEIEAMLIIQMATTHELILQMTGRCNRIHNETTLQQVDSRSVALSRLHRTFAMQVDALANLGRGGRQKIRVEHVHVYPGGQAVVGHVTTGGPRGEEKNAQQPHAIADGTLDAAMWRPDPQREAVPFLAGDGQAPMPHARRRARLRRAKRPAQRKLSARPTNG
jgi:hypothetical protein